MAGYWLLVLHALGDYVLQSDWMANTKTKKSWPAVAHALTYTLPFVLLFGFQWEPLLLIGGTHFVIDRWRLARYICWVKNFLAPRRTRIPGHLYLTTPPTRVGHIPERPKLRVGQQPEPGEPLVPVTSHPVTDLWWHPWEECQPTGYHKDKPVWLTMWLLFITDNVMHVAFNGLAWHLWGV